MTPRLLLLLVLLVLGWLAIESGLLERARDPEQVRAFLGGSGALGPALYVGGFSLLSPFGMPAALLVLAAVLVWPLWLAFLLSWLGALGAGMVGFGFARWLARDWVSQRLPPRLLHLDERAGERELATVVLVRLLFFLAPPAHWALGVSRVRLGPAALGSMLGMLPWTGLYVLGGRGVLEVARTGAPNPWLLGALALTAVLLALGGSTAHRRRNRRRRSRAAARPAGDRPPR